MSREVRRVAKDWQHPKDEHGNFIPLYEQQMPQWPKGEAVCFQMYETTSEGKPISPVMDTSEDLAQWLADNGASAFGGQTATYEQWLKVCRGRRAVTAVIENGEPRSGVEWQDR